MVQSFSHSSDSSALRRIINAASGFIAVVRIQVLVTAGQCMDNQFETGRTGVKTARELDSFEGSDSATLAPVTDTTGDWCLRIVRNRLSTPPQF